MADEPRNDESLSEEELAAQRGEQLPDREVMSMIDPGIPIGRIPDDSIIAPESPPELHDPTT